MKFVNCTPHPINFMDAENNVLFTVEPSGILARAKAETIFVGKEINGIPVTRTEYGEPEGFPQPEDGVVYLVSSLAAQAVRRKRDDVFVPADPVRDEAGHIIGCRTIAKID